VKPLVLELLRKNMPWERSPFPPSSSADDSGRHSKKLAIRCFATPAVWRRSVRRAAVQRTGSGCDLTTLAHFTVSSAVRFANPALSRRYARGKRLFNGDEIVAAQLAPTIPGQGVVDRAVAGWVMVLS
jgi:hypothetical protein